MATTNFIDGQTPVSAEWLNEVDQVVHDADGAAYVGYTPAGTGAVSTDVQTKLRESVSVKDFGAVGDGVTDDTAAIQAALNSGAKIVNGIPGDTYLVSYVSVKTILGTDNRYCLLLPDDVDFNLNGSTLKLANSQNATIIMNSTAGTTQNVDIGLHDGWLDGNETNQTTPATGEMPMIRLWDVLRPRVYNIKAKNARDYFGRFLKIDGGYLNNLHGKRSDGDGWSFGITASSQQVVNSFIDNIYAEDCTNGTYGTLQGNPAIFTVLKSNVGKVEGYNCGGGIKIQDQSEDSAFGQLLFRGGANGTANSGVKVQGADASNVCKRISIGQVVSENSYAEGLKITQYTEDVTVGSYIGKSCSTGAVGRDCEVNGTRTTINSVKSISPNGIGLLINSNATDYSIGAVSVYNPVGRAVQSAATGYGEIGSIIHNDDQGTPTTTEILAVTGTDSGRCGSIKTNLANPAAFPGLVSVAAGNYKYFIRSLVVNNGADPTGGWVTLTNASASTTVANTNIFRRYAGGTDYLHPIIQVQPGNSSAAALANATRVSGVTDYTTGTGFTLGHSVAGASDKVYWEVIGWRVLPSVFS